MKTETKLMNRVSIILSFLMLCFSLNASSSDYFKTQTSTITLGNGETHDICILTWNTKLKPRPFGGVGSLDGAHPDDICDALGEIADNYDVILLQEVWTSRAIKKLKECLEDFGFPFIRNVKKAGLLTASKHTITSGIFREYDAENGLTGCANDRLKDKGFLYTKILMEPGCFIHTINTHLDAGSCIGDYEARTLQMIQLSKYLEELQEIVCPEAVLLGGDLNISYYPERPFDPEAELNCIWYRVVGLIDLEIITYEILLELNIELETWDNWEDVPEEYHDEIHIDCEKPDTNAMYSFLLRTLNLSSSFDITGDTPPGTNEEENKIIDYIMYLNSSDSHVSGVTFNTLNDDDNFDNPSDHQPVESCFNYECPSDIAKNCEFNPYFSQTMCNIDNELEITVSAETDAPHHGWTIYLKDEGAPCESDNLDNTTIIHSISNSQESSITFTIPGFTYEELEGRCIIIKHGTWSECCDWWEFRRALPIPELSCDLVPYFTQELCDFNNQLEITVKAQTPSPYHGITVYLKDEGVACESNNLDNTTIIFGGTFHETTMTFSIPGYTYEELAGRCIIIKHGTWSNCCDWWEFRRAITLPETTCNFNPYFTQELCRNGNLLDITVSADAPSPYHGLTIYLKEDGAECESINLNNAEIIYEATATDMPMNFTLPYHNLVGKCIIIKHGTWNNCCDWWEFRRAITIPELPDLNPGFTFNYEEYNSNYDLFTYSVFTNNFPVEYNWTIEVGESLQGPWTTWQPGLVSDTSLPEVTSIQRKNKYYKVCNNVSSTLEEQCAFESKCIYIESDNFGGYNFLTEDGFDNDEDQDHNNDSTHDFSDNSEGNSESRFFNDLAPKTSAENNELILFPNPAKDFIVAENNSGIELNLELYNVDGKLINQKLIPANSKKIIPTDQLKSGSIIILWKEKSTGNLIKSQPMIITK